jgi:hypothetical protein
MVLYICTLGCDHVFVFGRLNTWEPIANPLPLEVSFAVDVHLPI